MAMQISLVIDCGMRTESLTHLCQLVAEAAGEPIPRRKPVVGAGVFTHESGIHVRALSRDGRAYEPFPAALVGGAGTRFVIGKHSGQRKRQRIETTIVDDQAVLSGISAGQPVGSLMHDLRVG